MRIKINNINELQKLIVSHSGFQIMENDDDRFILQCPSDSSVTIDFNNKENIQKIILNTIMCFEEFDSNERFNEHWNKSFSKHNGFTPSEFLQMLISDEKELHKMAKELREICLL